METFKVKAMLSAIKHKSLSKAAEEFSYTPSAFSHILTNFEQELGVKIFERSSKGVSLSADGEKLYQAFCDMRKAEDKVWEIVSGIKGTKDVSLHIASFSSMSRQLVSGVVKRIKKEYPHIKLNVSVADNVTGWIEENKADVVFADSGSFLGSDWLPLFEDEYCVIAQKGFFDGEEVIEREELYDYPYIYTEGFHTEKYIDTNKFKEITIFSSEDDLSILNMVKDGLGFSIIPRLVIKGSESEFDVLRLEPSFKRTMGVAFNRRKIEELGLLKFIKSIK